MKTVLKWIGIILGVLLVVIIIAGAGLSIAGNARANETMAVEVQTIPIPTDEEALARGAHLVHAACESCHGPDLSGQVIMDDPAIATLYAANITGLAETHTDAEIIKAIRHGLDTDGRQLMIMPSEAFIYFSQEDMGAIVAHLKSLPKVGDDTPPLQPGPMGRILMGAGAFDSSFPASYIDHSMPYLAMPEVGATAEYGEYLAGLCYSCHGPDLKGAQPADPASPPSPDITSSGRVGDWTDEEFLTFFHTGKTPYGAEISPDFMPWESFGKLDDEELRGLHLYLLSQ